MLIEFVWKGILFREWLPHGAGTEVLLARGLGLMITSVCRMEVMRGPLKMKSVSVVNDDTGASGHSR